jgi:hypothetical protein
VFVVVTRTVVGRGGGSACPFKAVFMLLPRCAARPARHHGRMTTTTLLEKKKKLDEKKRAHDVAVAQTLESARWVVAQHKRKALEKRDLDELSERVEREAAALEAMLQS